MVEIVLSDRLRSQIDPQLKPLNFQIQLKNRQLEYFKPLTWTGSIFCRILFLEVFLADHLSIIQAIKEANCRGDVSEYASLTFLPYDDNTGIPFQIHLASLIRT